jgi:hypothetical protein
MTVNATLAHGLTVLSGFLFGSVVAVIAVDEYVKPILTAQPWLIVVTCAVCVVLLWTGQRLMPKTTVRTILTEARSVSRENVSLETRKALIGLVSPYTPRPGNTSPLKPEERQKAIEDGNPELLDLEHSNLWPLVSAILHYPQLQRCWLISSGGPGGSLASTRLIVNYVQQHKPNIQFTYGLPWIVMHPFTPQVVGDTKRLLESAIQTARENYAEHEIITDVTGGTVPMSLGAVLACVHPKLDVQYTGVNNVNGTLEPIVFGFEYQPERIKS